MVCNRYAIATVPWSENMTSSIKPKVNNVWQRRQRRTEPLPQATCMKLVKFSSAVFELCKRTDKQTYSSQFFAPLTRVGGGEVNETCEGGK